MMRYVLRDNSGKVIGEAGAPQDGWGEEGLADDHPDILAFRNRPAVLVDYAKALCEQKLAGGFDYDFGDARGVHRIGTTAGDLKGWDEVEKIFAIASRMGDLAKTVTIATDTGVAVINLGDWNGIMLAAEAFRQPIWAASFAIQAKIAAGLITGAAEIDTAEDWPA